METDTKKCSVCKDRKPMDSFVKDKARSDGIGYVCRECRRELSQKYYHKQGGNEIAHQNYLKNREKKIAYTKDYRKRNPNCRRVETYKRLSEQTGLPREMVKQLFEKRYTEQQGRCAICGKSEDELQESGKLNFDHCHESNKLRGLLCNNCNLAIGNFQDDAEICLLAYNYLRRF